MITADMLKRKLIFDAMTDPARIFELIGLIGVSEEGAEFESEDSLRRLHGILPLLPLLEEISSWLAEIATTVQFSNLEGIVIPEGFMEQMNGMFNSVITGSLVSVLSVFTDLGLIKVVPPEEFNDGR